MRPFCSVFLLVVAHYALAQKTIQVEYRKNIELINLLAVQNTPTLLKDVSTDAWLNENTVLMQRSYKQFERVRQHPIFRIYQRLEDSLGTGTYLLGLYYSDVPNARRIADLPPIITSAISPKHDSVVGVIDDFFGQLNGLYRDIQLDQFLAKNQSIYEKARLEVSKNLPKPTFVSTMERYYGATKHGYYLVVNPFFKSGWGMGWEVPTKAGADIYNITAPFLKAVVTNDGRLQSPGFDDPANIRRLSVHEFGHSFVNPLAYQAAHKEQIEHFKQLYAPIKGESQYDNWHTQFCEYVVRAGEVRLALAMNNPADAQAVEKQNANWPYLRHFVHQLERYEQNRTTYPTFESYLPVLISSLGELQK